MKRGSHCYLALATALVLCIALGGIAAAPPPSAAAAPQTFASYQALDDYLRRNMEIARQFGYGVVYRGPVTDMALPEAGVAERAPAPAADAAKTQAATVDYSRTNVQVEGVDEADLVKSDGSRLYVVSGGEVVILSAYPPGNAKVLARIGGQGTATELFIHGDRLVVFGIPAEGSGMFARVYDVSDPANIEPRRTLSLPGSYVSSRLIGDYAYVVATTPVTERDGRFELPAYQANGLQKVVPPGRIYYFDCPDYSYRYTQVFSFNVRDDRQETGSTTFLTGVSQNVFASPSALYLTNVKTPDLGLFTNRLLDGLATLVPAPVAQRLRSVRNSPAGVLEKLQRAEDILTAYMDTLDYGAAWALEEKVRAFREKWQRDLERERDKTTVHKLVIAGNAVTWRAQGEVPGQVLNQYSMDEHRGFFRIATTSQGWLLSGESTTRNNVFVLNARMETIGRLEGLAPGERIYSARFMGNRAYLVTFRQVDPLFVLDVSEPTAPRMLGQLKIPGYSDYLHPYDDTHLIGIGKETAPVPVPVPLLQEDSAVNVSPGLRAEVAPRIIPPPVPVPGLKLSLFDVSNPAQPREISKYVVEGYSDSLALRDPKALLFSRARNLLVLPVTVETPYYIMERPDRSPYPGPWQGAYVFAVSPQNGITLQGRIQHGGEAGFTQWEEAVKRSLYIEDVLYTVSERLVQMNRLPGLEAIGQVRLQPWAK
ncbi:MAG: beta-propeller domain-containing protein [Syntrophomonadaceae bacterium]|nr:beta-propeller domain-containing protein [Syntrophomonadaceae bacterium]MDH7497539.1 beta-propeller domain-containing protein [Syntrophomonadaceae bacterium]